MNLGKIKISNMSLTCSQCSAAVANYLRMVSSLISKTREVPRCPNPSASGLRPISTFFRGLRRSKKALPVRLEEAFPQVRRRKSRAFRVHRVRYVPLEATLLRPFLPYFLHLGLGQVISKYFGLGPRFFFALLAILFSFQRRG